MKTVNKMSPATAKENYEEFTKMIDALRLNDYNMILFYGNPTMTTKSWCPDCISVYKNFMSFAKEYDGKARLFTVPVGTAEEFGEDNPFKANFPHLVSIPTLMIFQIMEHEGKTYKMPWLKIIEPSLEDIRYFAKKYDLKSI